MVLLLSMDPIMNIINNYITLITNLIGNDQTIKTIIRLYSIN